MYLLIVFLPLLSALTVLSFGRYLGREGSVLLTVSSLFITAAMSTTAFYEVALCGSVCHIKLAPWITSELLEISWGFLFDSLTAVMLVVVTYVSALVHLYSVSYMEEDPHLPRFMSYLSLFTFFMLMLVTGDNFLQLFLGWEGVGLASYLLINFWYSRIQANKSAIKAMVMNRIGDFGLALGLMAIFAVFKSIDYSTVFATAPFFSNENFLFCNLELDQLTVICLLLFVGAVGKSAQLGLHTWLPDAMEGPTPVSALIHAATMVTAGVFMICRCSPLFEYAPDALFVITLVGASTAFFAATVGVVQNDLKRVIAYSTCSQLGYMVFSCGLSSYSVSMFHLMNHAFFKALLFLSAGSVIHAMGDEQDMRRMGGLLNLLPFTYTMMLIGSLSLVGFPFLTGFYSKDVILELAYGKYTVSGTFAHWLGSLSVFFTSFYSFRLIYLTFINKTNSHKSLIEGAHDAPIIMAIPLMILAVGSIFVGYVTKDLMIGLGTTFWSHSLFVLPVNMTSVESEFLDASIKCIPLFFSGMGATVAFILCYANRRLNFRLTSNPVGRGIYTFLNKRWLVDAVYNVYGAAPLMRFGYSTSFRLLDTGFIQMFGPRGLSTLLLELSSLASRFQSGYVYHYAFIMVCGATILVGFINLWPFTSLYLSNKLYFIYVLLALMCASLVNPSVEENK
uniref:NADH-ubiquinone oxidoreductase chain 5 n=1 Tax=Ancoracysta twista TaxID=2044563 RepID=A0A2H4R8E4_9EUKA|nr:NADH dehydrogenase subunit 5 [Ancoracysta twista]ATY40917.1 NADH dehydrogenase subunit 5 [Ancoracysta twista]